MTNTQWGLLSYTKVCTIIIPIFFEFIKEFKWTNTVYLMVKLNVTEIFVKNSDSCFCTWKKYNEEKINTEEHVKYSSIMCCVIIL